MQPELQISLLQHAWFPHLDVAQWQKIKISTIGHADRRKIDASPVGFLAHPLDSQTKQEANQKI